MQMSLFVTPTFLCHVEYNCQLYIKKQTSAFLVSAHIGFTVSILVEGRTAFFHITKANLSVGLKQNIPSSYFPLYFSLIFHPHREKQDPIFCQLAFGFIISALLVVRTGVDILCFSALSGFGGHQAVL